MGFVANLFGWDRKLCEAAEDGNIDVVREMLKKNVNINAKVKYISANMRKAYESDPEIFSAQFIEKSAERKKGYTPLIRALVEGHNEIAKLLIENGADINASTERGNSALMLASSAGHVEIVKLLIEKGANINEAGVDGTALMQAEKNEKHEIVMLIKNAGAK